jgi:hypothetical protein
MPDLIPICDRREFRTDQNRNSLLYRAFLYQQLYPNRPVYNLMLKLTDPVTVRLLTQIEADLSEYERRFAELYRQRFAGTMTKPAKPSTGAVVTAS